MKRGGIAAVGHGAARVYVLHAPPLHDRIARVVMQHSLYEIRSRLEQFVTAV